MNAFDGAPGSHLQASGTSRTLLGKVRADEPAAWDRLVALYGPLVLKWCGRWSLQESDRADVFQEVFRSVAQHISQFQRQRAGGSFRGWLWTITRNKVHDHFRRLQNEPAGEGGTGAATRWAMLPAESLGSESAPGEPAPDHGLCRRALSLIQCEFEPRTWQAFWRTAVEGQAAALVGEELGMTAGAVRVAKSRVLRRLRDELGDGPD